MKKIINVQPIPEIELQFADGKSLLLRFDVEALTHFNDIEGGIKAFVSDASIPEMCAKEIYVSAVSNNPGFTLEDARTLVSNMSPFTITEIMNEFSESMGSAKNGVQQELQKKMMAEFLNSLK